MAMRKHGIENFICEVIDHANTQDKLRALETYWMVFFNSVRRGYNMNYGGGGPLLETLPASEQIRLREARSRGGKKGNIIKWKNTTFEERQEIVNDNLHSPEANAKRSVTIEKEWADMPKAEKNHKLRGLDIHRRENKETFAEQARINGRKAIEKTAKSFLVKDPNGNEYIYKNKSQFKREIGLLVVTVIDNTRRGKKWKGWQAWDLNEKGEKL